MGPEASLITEGVNPNEIRETLGRYLHSDYFIGRGYSENTRQAYSTDLTQFGESCQSHGVLSINTLKPEDVAMYANEVATQSGFLPATISRKFASLTGFLRWASLEGLVREDLTEVLPKQKRPKRALNRSLTPNQIEDLITEANSGESFRDASLILLALGTGANATEIVNLNREDVIQVTDDQLGVRFRGLGKRTAPRTILLDEEASAVVGYYLRQKQSEPGDPLFPGRWQGRLSRKSFFGIIRGYGTKIGDGGEDLSPRVLRNTFIINFQGERSHLAEALGILKFP